jgi:hypothetical protein
MIRRRKWLYTPMDSQVRIFCGEGETECVH